MKSLFFLVLFFPALALAKPSDLTKLKDANPGKSASISCKTCHPKGKELNDYGKLYKAQGVKAELK